MHRIYMVMNGKFSSTPPSTISGEFMTEHRRWQVLSVIDARIRLSEEFRIFETDDYYDSWWTLAEPASLAYIAYTGKPALPKMVLCKPSVQGLSRREAESKFVQVLSEQREVSFGRYLSDNDPLTMPAAVLATCARRSGDTPCRR